MLERDAEVEARFCKEFALLVVFETWVRMTGAESMDISVKEGFESVEETLLNLL